MNRSVIAPLSAKHRQSVSRWQAVWLHAVVVGIVAATLPLREPSLTLILGGLLITPAYVWIARFEVRRSPLWLSPLSFYFIWYTVGSGLSAVYVGVQLAAGHPATFALFTLTDSDAAAGYAIFLLGAVCMHAAMEWWRPRPEHLAVNANYRPVRPLWLLALFTAGILYKLKINWFAGAGILAQPLFWAPIAVLLMLLVLPRSWFGLPATLYWAFVGGGFAVLLYANLRTGSKAYIMFSFVPLIWASLLRPTQRRWLPVWAIAMTALYLFVVQPTISKARITPMREHETATSHVIGALEEPTATGSWLDTTSTQTDHFLHRQFDSAPVAFLVMEVREGGVRWGETMRYASYALIPRLIWPDKPAVTRGSWFTAYLGMAARESEATTSTGLTAIGELYWNFALPGVVLGSALLGWMNSVAWRLTGENPIYQPLRLLLYVSAISGTDMAEFVSAATGRIAVILLFASIFWIESVVGQRRHPGDRHTLTPGVSAAARSTT